MYLVLEYGQLTLGSRNIQFLAHVDRGSHDQTAHHYSHINYLGGGRVVRWCWVKLPVPGCLTNLDLLIWIIVGHGPAALAVGAGGDCFDIFSLIYPFPRGWSGRVKVLGKLSVPGRPTCVWMIVGQGPIALAVGAGGCCLDIFFSHLSFLFSFSLSLGDGPI